MLLAAICAVTALAVLPSSAWAIQPGDYQETDAGACTLSFVYDGGGKTYMGTAAHCVESVGQDVRLLDGRTFGDVAFIGNQDVTQEDYAFIEVRPEFLAEVDPSVKGSPGLPSGSFTTPPETARGDLIQLSGYGLGFGATQPTRERRQAVMGFDDAELYDVTGPLIFGDSGGPLVHLKTGKALGIVSRLCIGVCTEEGPTVQGILAKAAARGFSVTLRTAG
jgi:hypothetical protein